MARRCRRCTRYQRRWELLGYSAFVAMVAVFYLMVNKPTLPF
ncbi:DUF2269 family protein [Variovorax sp. LT2P21]